MTNFVLVGDWNCEASWQQRFPTFWSAVACVCFILTMRHKQQHQQLMQGADALARL